MKDDYELHIKIQEISFWVEELWSGTGETQVTREIQKLGVQDPKAIMAQATAWANRWPEKCSCYYAEKIVEKYMKEISKNKGHGVSSPEVER